jgi:hypothetical protein
MERLAGYKHNTGIVRRLLFKPQTKTPPRKKQANTHTHTHKKIQKPFAFLEFLQSFHQYIKTIKGIS